MDAFSHNTVEQRGLDSVHSARYNRKRRLYYCENNRQKQHNNYVFQLLCVLLDLFSQVGGRVPSSLKACSVVFSLQHIQTDS